MYVFLDRCLSFCTFSFGNCVVCSSSIYGFLITLLASSNSSCIAFEITWSLYLTYIFFNIFFIYLLTKFLYQHIINNTRNDVVRLYVGEDRAVWEGKIYIWTGHLLSNSKHTNTLITLYQMAMFRLCLPLLAIHPFRQAKSIGSYYPDTENTPNEWQGKW